MKFRIGNKVKVLDNTSDHRGEKGIIVITGRIAEGQSNYWDYAVEFEDNTRMVYSTEEIRLLYTKNEQLLLWDDLYND